MASVASVKCQHRVTAAAENDTPEVPAEPLAHRHLKTHSLHGRCMPCLSFDSGNCSCQASEQQKAVSQLGVAVQMKTTPLLDRTWPAASANTMHVRGEVFEACFVWWYAQQDLLVTVTVCLYTVVIRTIRQAGVSARYGY